MEAYLCGGYLSEGAYLKQRLFVKASVEAIFMKAHLCGGVSL